MNSATILQLACLVAIGLLILAMVCAVIRLIRGPNLGDRILALDLITVLGAGFVGAIAVLTGFSLYIDVAVALALVSFLSTVALARYLFVRASRRQQEGGRAP